METLTKEMKMKLLKNGRESLKAIEFDGNVPDHFPVVLLVTLDCRCRWLLSEVDPERPDIAFGLCDLGVGFPELGSVSLSELDAVPVFCDSSFKAKHHMSWYVERANQSRSIRIY